MTVTPSDDPNRFPLLAVLEPVFRTKAMRSLRWRDFAAGEVVMNHDDDSCEVHFLDSGRLFAVYWTADGREIVFSTIPEGSYFGELMALDGAPRSLCVYARTPARLAAMSATVFRSLIDESAAFRQAILRDLASRVRDLTERNCQLTAYSVPDRVKAFILRRTAEKGGLHPGVVLSGFPTHAEIAAQIGANREAVSRALSMLRRKGVIATHRGDLTILDPEGLVVLSEQ